ncbi:MAG: M15 family metallopeptidase [Eubacterium sp.]|nr:M15 family metallopeptidase [Eubacterium sp.]
MRDLSALHPRLQRKIAQLQQLCKKNGLTIGIGECLRTVAEQDALYAQGRTKPGKIVTNAKGNTYSSQHQWGIAADFYRDDGKGAYHTQGGFFDKVGALAKSIGLGWGGDWKSPVDKPHLYLPDWGSTPALLKTTYKTPENFRKTWGNVPAFQTGRTYEASAPCYLRISAGAKSTNTVLYSTLSDTLKKKCKSSKGLAVLKKKKRFRLVKTKQVKENMWGQMKSGYWVPLYYHGKIRAVPVK